MDLTHFELEMMKHAFGFYERNPGYRDRYCTHLDNKPMLELVKKEVFQGPHGVGTVGKSCGMFYLTPKAKSFLKRLAVSEGRMKRNCDNCDFIEYVDHDEEAYSGFCCNKRQYKTSAAETKHLGQLDNIFYRRMTKSCFALKEVQP